MKKPLYWAIKPGYTRAVIIAVTKERAGHWWGRSAENDIGTHGRAHDLRGRFETFAAARAIMDRVQSIYAHFRNQNAILDTARQQLSTAEKAMVEQTITGIAQRSAYMVVVECEVKMVAPTSADERAANYLTHTTRVSDSSVYDEKCTQCGATDANGDVRLGLPCPSPKEPAEC